MWRAHARAGLTSTVVFPRGNIAPDGAVIKATAIDPTVVDDDNIYRHRGPVRVFTSETAAIAAIKGTDGGTPIKANDVLVLIGAGPAGTGMEETYQLTSALKFIPWGKHVPILTDARFSGVSTGACVGHVGPEALAGGPIGKLRDGDIVEIDIDRNDLTGSIDLVATADSQQDLTPDEAARFATRTQPSSSPAPQSGAARRHAIVGRAATGQRRHLGRLRLRRRRIVEVLEAGIEVLGD